MEDHAIDVNRDRRDLFDDERVGESQPLRVSSQLLGLLDKERSFFPQRAAWLDPWDGILVFSGRQKTSC